MIDEQQSNMHMQEIITSSRIEDHSQSLQHGQQLIAMPMQQQQLPFTQQQHYTIQQHQHQHVPQPQCILYNNDIDSSQLTMDSTSCFVYDDYTPTLTQTKQEAMTECVDITNTSDVSTVDESNTEADILPVDEAYTYLQGLNSDNLMQFSQQSAIQEMMNNQLDIKPNLRVLPTFEEHDLGGYKFQLNFRTQRKVKVGWTYSETLNKIYIRMNDIFSLSAVYTPKTPRQQLRIRALMCFAKEVSEPVVRCQNHISKDTTPHKQHRHSLLRCENPSTEYCGTAEGKNINDRYSVLIPLNTCLMPKKDNSVQQTIDLKFTCQNSCIGRKETSLIFLLEGTNGEIHSQRVLDVKVCSCPKRDRVLDERNTETTKRKMDDDLYPRSSKVSKTDPLAPVDSVKDERPASDMEDNDSDSSKEYDVQRTPSGGFRVVMDMRSKDVALCAIESTYNAVAGRILSQPSRASYFTQDIRKLKRLHKKIQKM